jgi:hypothetical protein
VSNSSLLTCSFRSAIKFEEGLESCTVCGQGGNLIICDGCTSGFHVTVECANLSESNVPCTFTIFYILFESVCCAVSGSDWWCNTCMNMMKQVLDAKGTQRPSTVPTNDEDLTSDSDSSSFDEDIPLFRLKSRSSQ